MKEHHISVMSLEEFEPNREFVGRNFNAGEVIQLVLKSASTGRWLPFNYVQMVMMHEYVDLIPTHGRRITDPACQVGPLQADEPLESILGRTQQVRGTDAGAMD